jgi:hypothetical protein
LIFPWPATFVYQRQSISEGIRSSCIRFFLPRVVAFQLSLVSHACKEDMLRFGAGRFSRYPVFVTKNYIQWSGGLVYRTCDFKGSTNRFRKNMSIMFNPCWRWFTVLCFCQSDIEISLFYHRVYTLERPRHPKGHSFNVFWREKRFCFKLSPFPDHACIL